MGSVVPLSLVFIMDTNKCDTNMCVNEEACKVQYLCCVHKNQKPCSIQTTFPLILVSNWRVLGSHLFCREIKQSQQLNRRESVCTQPALQLNNSQYCVREISDSVYPCGYFVYTFSVLACIIIFTVWAGQCCIIVGYSPLEDLRQPEGSWELTNYIE